MKYQKEFLEKFPNQIEYVLNNYVRHNLSIDSYTNVVLGGLGGSGIAGRIVKKYLYSSCPVPIEVISDYDLPAYVDDGSLVILSSYSGNTEETLSMYIQAVERQAKVLTITTGGVLGELAEENNIQSYIAEKGFQPRMALGYSFTYLLLIFSELLKRNLSNNIKGFVKNFYKTDTYIKQAGKLFKKISNDLDSKVAIVCDPNSFPIGVRFAQQINENAKGEAFVHELPEANHNVIESYYGKLDSVFLLINSGLNEKINYRFEFLKKLLSKSKHKIIDVNPDGFSLKDIFETIYVLDWLSLYISDAKGVRSDEIPNIINLKNFLKEK